MNTDLNNETIDTPPIDAATVVLLREGSAGLEVLLLCRANSRTVMNNAWVFPGGKVDISDGDNYAQVSTSLNASLGSDAETLLDEPELETRKATALFHAACRETMEETGVAIAEHSIYPWSRWITPNEPSMMKKRFDARFFIAAMPSDQTAVHDGVEATDSAWHTPHNALREYLNNKIVLAPPQIMTLAALARLPDIAACFESAKSRPPPCIQPSVLKSAGDKQRTLLYPGDAKHPEPRQLMPGPTRLIWRDNHFEPVDGFDGFFRD